MDVLNAAERGDLERTMAVVEGDAGMVHAMDEVGWTPLLCAAVAGHVEVARYLLDHGATVNHRDDYGRTALHWACRWGHRRVALLLLQRDADVTAVDRLHHGATPLTDAGRYGCDAIVRLLLEHGGSDVDAADHGGMTACHWACFYGHAGVLKQLMEAGADPTLREDNGRNAGEDAADNDHQACVTVLQEWQRAYSLARVRGVLDAESATRPAALPGL